MEWKTVKLGEVCENIYSGGECVPFTKTEFELLRLLLEERGKVFSRQELIDRVWPKDVMVLDRQRVTDVFSLKTEMRLRHCACCWLTAITEQRSSRWRVWNQC